MKRAIFALLALTLLASSSGCCCLDKLFCWGCRGRCAYGNEGWGCGSCGGGCGNSGCSNCGSAGGANGPGGSYGPGTYGSGGPAYGPGTPTPAPMSSTSRRPAQGHPYVKQRRDSDDEYEFAAGPPTGATTYPYYTNRGPRDFLARNPRSIGP